MHSPHNPRNPSRNRYRHTSRRCAPHRRRDGEETMKPSTADAHTQKDATMHPSRRPPTPP
ncbi:MAG: hypothetical protein ACO2PN_22240 [Pyrobaculum sp.]